MKKKTWKDLQRGDVIASQSKAYRCKVIDVLPNSALIDNGVGNIGWDTFENLEKLGYQIVQLEEEEKQLSRKDYFASLPKGEQENIQSLRKLAHYYEERFGLKPLTVCTACSLDSCKHTFNIHNPS